MKYIKLSLLVATLALLAGLTTSVFAENKQQDRELIVSFDENFTSNSTIDGTTALAGAYSDTGTRHYNFTTQQHGDEVIVTGTIVITATKGTLTAKFTGSIPANGSNPNYIEGIEYFTGGTGAYAGINARGTFEATINFDTGNIVGVGEFLVRSK